MGREMKKRVLSVFFLLMHGVSIAQEYSGQTLIGDYAIQELAESIMIRHHLVRSQLSQLHAERAKFFKEHPIKSRSTHRARNLLKQDRDARAVASFPEGKKQKKRTLTRAPAPTIGVNFRAARFSDSGFFPPDSMGAIGPLQFTMAINGLIKSFNKQTGLADNGIDADLDVFFNSVRGGKSTSDPRIRYDRLSDRWFVIAITVPNSGANKLLIAVSDSGTLSSGTMWKFFSVAMGGDIFLDYPTLGIDANALYVGGETFSNSNSGRVLVIRKSSILATGPIVSTAFDNMISPAGEGMYVPQGVDNFDPSPTYGFFIGVDNLRFGSLVMRRVSNAGGSPTISGNIRFSVPTTHYPLRVPHLGNQRGFAGRLDALDDRLMMAHIRGDSLWTTHNIGVNNNGVASGTLTRNGCRWYQINNLDGSPNLVQSGTLYKRTSKNNTSARSYWMPSLMVTGQRTMALGCSIAGAKSRINAAVARRFASDGLGVLSSPVFFTGSSTAYNPPSDPGSNSRPRRWGDYSYTSVDPSDDMTLWTIQEYCDATNSWGVRVAQIDAPPPAHISSLSTSSVSSGQTDVPIQINAISQNGSGFFDPGDGFVNRLDVSISGGVNVTEIEYINPTTIAIQISTVGASAGSKNVTVTNPDGQSTTSVGALTVS